MRQILFFLLVLLSCAYKASFIVLASNIDQESFIDVTVHNIGQGNCVTARIYENSTNIYLLFDAGSTSYTKELNYREFFKQKAKNKKDKQKESTIPQNLNLLSTRKPRSQEIETFEKGLREEKSKNAKKKQRV